MKNKNFDNLSYFLENKKMLYEPKKSKMKQLKLREEAEIFLIS